MESDMLESTTIGRSELGREDNAVLADRRQTICHCLVTWVHQLENSTAEQFHEMMNRYQEGR